MYLDLEIPPGAFALGTARQARGRWRDGTLVRSPDGANLQPVGGWAERGSSPVAGLARAIVSWRDGTGTRWLGIGTHEKLYVQSNSGALYDVTPAGFVAGRADAASGGGFGDGPYGTGAFGTPRSDTESILAASVWTLDTFGSRLVGCMADDGRLYEWGLNTSAAAAQIVGSPTNCSGLSVSQEGFLFAYQGATISWCDQENETVWAAAADNQAGDLTLNSYGSFRFGRKVPGAQLHFTEVDVWRSTYQGPPVVYGFTKVGDQCGPVSNGAATTVDSRCVWMGLKSFWLYNGAGVEALPCEVADKVFADFNPTQASKVTSFHHAQFGEVWWFYPSSASSENDSYVFWNYRLNHWWFGKLARTCAVGAGIFAYPVMVDPSGAIWEHERGWSYAGAAGPFARPFARSGPTELPGVMGQGDQRMLIKGFVADEKALGDCADISDASAFCDGTSAANLTGAAPCGVLPPETGDVTTSGCAATLANTGVIAGTYGDATDVPQITVNGKGQVTSATTVVVSGGSGLASGTSFPGSPSSGALFFRTDRGLIYYYDGARWLTVNEYTIQFYNMDGPSLPYNAAATLRAKMAPYTGTYDFYMEKLFWSVYVSGFNNGAQITGHLHSPRCKVAQYRP
jgi:hypothetical protein